MSWHARRLVDLVDSLASRFNKRRYDALAQQLGRSPEAGDSRRRGFVIVQIDGLAYDYLVEAMARGYVPRLRRVLSWGRYRLARWRCGLPSTTPAVQAGMMFGDAFDIPGFRWYEKEEGWSVACKLPRAARVLQARVAAAGPGILRGGSSYMSLLDGDARLSLLTLGSLREGNVLENVKGVGFLFLFLLSPLRVVRVAVSTSSANCRWERWAVPRVRYSAVQSATPARPGGSHSAPRFTMQVRLTQGTRSYSTPNRFTPVGKLTW